MRAGRRKPSEGASTGIGGFQSALCWSLSGALHPGGLLLCKCVTGEAESRQVGGKCIFLLLSHNATSLGEKKKRRAEWKRNAGRKCRHFYIRGVLSHWASFSEL